MRLWSSTSPGGMVIAFCGLFVAANAGVVMMDCKQPDNDTTTLYDFTLMDVHKMKNISLSDYRGKQEPGANGTEIMNGITHVRPGSGFVPKFPIFEKIEVNGNNEHKLFTYLKRNCPPTKDAFDPTLLFYTPIRGSDVAWNWETFLVGADGRVINRSPPATDPESLSADIDLTLAKTRRCKSSRIFH